MKVFCGASDPYIDKAVGLLQSYEASASDKYLNAKKCTARAMSQEPDIIRREETFKTLRNLLRNRRLDLEAYKAEVLNLHKFEPKRKYLEELEDTDESDDPDDEEDHSDDETAGSLAAYVDSLGDVFADVGLADARSNVDDAVDDAARIPCRFCAKLFKPRGMNRYVNSAHRDLV